MKKMGLILVLALGLGACQNQKAINSEPAAGLPTEAKVVKKEIVTLVVNSGEKIATYSASLQEGATVLSVLEQIDKQENLNLITKTFSFGTLVEGLAGKENTAKKAWIYYVNGLAAEVGAGEKQLEDGDLVEWKYIPPIY